MKEMVAKFFNRKLTKSAKSQSKRKCYSICYAPEIPEELR
jgi:cyclic lactone autoinducer peptide